MYDESHLCWARRTISRNWSGWKQMCYKVVVFNLVVKWRGKIEPSLNDDLNSTCLALETSSLQNQTEHIVLKQDYDDAVDVWLSGRGLVCAPDNCTNQYPTQVFQQGGNPGFCVKDAPLCLGASLCPLVSYTHHPSGGWVTCQFRCDCPVESSAMQTWCEKVVVMFGNGSVASDRDKLELCDVSVSDT